MNTTFDGSKMKQDKFDGPELECVNCHTQFNMRRPPNGGPIDGRYIFCPQCQKQTFYLLREIRY